MSSRVRAMSASSSMCGHDRERGRVAHCGAVALQCRRQFAGATVDGDDDRAAVERGRQDGARRVGCHRAASPDNARSGQQEVGARRHAPMTITAGLRTPARSASASSLAEGRAGRPLAGVCPFSMIATGRSPVSPPARAAPTSRASCATPMSTTVVTVVVGERRDGRRAWARAWPLTICDGCRRRRGASPGCPRPAAPRRRS